MRKRNLTRLTFGIGYTTDGQYIKSSNNIKTPEYICWQSMLRRCYDLKYLQRQPTYKNTTVCKEWLDFQVFVKWYEENNLFDYELDKDILIPGNNIYSSETCCFVPKEINTLLLSCNSKRGELPIGVIIYKNRYRVRLSKFGQQVNLGYFDTPELAFIAYKNGKEQHIKDVANKHKSNLREDVYIALLNYQVNFDD